MKSFIKQTMIAGLLVIIPIALTYIVLAFVIGKLDQLMAPVVTWIIVRLQLPLPEDFHLPGLGFILICLFIFTIGMVTANFFRKATGTCLGLSGAPASVCTGDLSDNPKSRRRYF